MKRIEMNPPPRASINVSSESPTQPRLTFHSNENDAWFGSVTLDRLAPDLMAGVRSAMDAAHPFRSIIRVSVVPQELSERDGLPDVFGRFQILEDGVRFIPHFPFEPGVRYQAICDPRPLGRPQDTAPVRLEFSLPEQRNTNGRLPVVKQIFPSSDCLPENLLRFYVHFSDSMRRGHAETQIALLGPDGRRVRDVLYRPPVELWDRAMRYLTILLDPGRLKRGVGPNRELGPPLKAGLEYTLAVGSGMADRFGRPLHETFCKRFRVIEAVREQIAVETWTLAPPATSRRAPLVLRFPRPLDRALLPRTIRVFAEDEQSIKGRVVIDQSETRWSFTPASAWPQGSYSVRIEPSLEDICGNSLTAPFDRPINSYTGGADRVRTYALRFHLF